MNTGTNAVLDLDEVELKRLRGIIIQHYLETTNQQQEPARSAVEPLDSSFLSRPSGLSGPPRQDFDGNAQRDVEEHFARSTSDPGLDKEKYWRSVSPAESHLWGVPTPSPQRSSLDGRPTADELAYQSQFLTGGRSISGSSITSLEYSNPWANNPYPPQAIPGGVGSAHGGARSVLAGEDSFAALNGPVLVRSSSSISSRGSASPTESSPQSVATGSQVGTGARNQLFKTELCRTFMETGKCRYGSKCQFAHGQSELRPVKRHPKYKTKVCRNFAETGSCPYGSRCRFIHGNSIRDEIDNDVMRMVQSLGLNDSVQPSLHHARSMPVELSDPNKRLPVFQMFDEQGAADQQVAGFRSAFEARDDGSAFE
eukprot:CAMPEP_0198322046 /NCGR_PEP_ID=MMETSP1450-20131203/10608_1 /TAXON_ID=753684 ORGANISM="Madagascaria erythrocladiodes, Strain CCMP3234" /NCGR_SAMPLE_ID=MMETSP1450 /ASSEMBLY_ACC=CAM_ASM_001115 /LENGTH=368 /DNA_ID=CAMNT_0044025637 /DNA_START=253 /DNA_END=1359 /DNA_ORIENTATION=+